MKTREELLKEFEEEPTAKKFSKSDKVIHFTPEELQQILSAPTKEQMECPYCNFQGGYFPKKPLLVDRDYGNDDEINGMGAGIQLDMEGRPTLGIWANADEVGYQRGLDINFCPICGRKLGDE